MLKKIFLSSAFVMIIGMAAVSIGLSYSYAAEANVRVKCDPPKLGTYWLGWGTSRLEVDQNGRVSIGIGKPDSESTDQLKM